MTLLVNGRMPAVAQAVASDLGGCARVLELGAGTGLVTEALAPVVETLVATDPAPGMRRALEERLAQKGFAHEKAPRGAKLRTP